MKIEIFFIIISIGTFGIKAQVLDVTEVIQEQSQWCWAATSACILDFYGHPVSQCDITEYARTVEQFNDVNLGSKNCCQSPSSCNKWNYIVGGRGSIEDILEHFGDIGSSYKRTFLSKSEITELTGKNIPFIIRWEHNDGSGHFIVGHGLTDDNLHYMDPWNGEGLKVGSYSWVKESSSQRWAGTMQMTSPPTPEEPSTADTTSEKPVTVYPVPVRNILNIEVKHSREKIDFEICNISGVAVHRATMGRRTVIDFSSYKQGIYLIRFETGQIVKIVKK